MTLARDVRGTLAIAAIGVLFMLIAPSVLELFTIINLTTAIALESSKGEFGLAIALGIILLLTAFGANILFHWLQGFDD